MSSLIAEDYFCLMAFSQVSTCNMVFHFLCPLKLIQGGWEPIQATIMCKAGCTLDRLLVHHRASTDTN